MSLYDDLEGTATHSRTVYHARNAWYAVFDVISSDRGNRAVQATWHCHPNASVHLDSTTGTATIGGVDGPTGTSLPAQLAVVPATGSSARWSSSKVVKGVRAGKDGATEDQGWYSRDYVDAEAAPVLVYDAKLASSERMAVFAWLLLPSPTSSGLDGAAIQVNSIHNGTVSASITVRDETKQITVPFETA